ncbi:MAG: TetR/AcrR family transcriptional regulator [Myxococcota bacterium]
MAAIDPAENGLTRIGKAERTRLRLVDAVRAEIQSEGSFSAQSVAERTESSPATFYNHFPSKSDAILAAFDAVMVDLVSFVGRTLDVARALEMGLADFLADWTWQSAEFFHDNSVVFAAARSQMPGSPEFRTVYRTREAEALVHYVRFVRLAQRAGIARDGDPQALAEVLMLVSEGWNHPLVLRMTRGDAFHVELARSVQAMLAPETESK